MAGNGSATTVLLQLVGSVALLIWGVRLVRTGAVRAAGPHLRSLLAASMRNRFVAFGSGAAVTLVTQSSSATALITAGFVAVGLVPLAMALAVLLGADLGSAIAVVVLSADIRWLWTIFVAGGVAIFMRSASLNWRGVGRCLVGLGLMLLALTEVAAAAAMLRQSATLASLLSAMAGEPVIAFIAAALLAWLLHSTLATVLIGASLASAGILPVPLALVLVLGANAGGALVPLLSLRGGAIQPWRMALGNFIMRAVPALPLVAVAPRIAGAELLAGYGPALVVVGAHVAYNSLVAVLGLALLDGLARLLETRIAERRHAPDPGRAVHLDASVLDTPSEAIACAMRETLRLGEAVTGMMWQALEALEGDDIRKVTDTEQSDVTVDRLYEAIKLYLVAVSRAELTESESKRFVEILAFVTNLEHVGDIIDKNLMELAAKKIRNCVQFSAEGLAELRDFHGHVLDTARLALNVFATRDVALARRLFADKTITRDAERRATERHFARLKEGRPESLETSAIHLDVIRDLKRIHGHFTSVAYPILESQGELASTRLVQPADSLAAPAH